MKLLMEEKVFSWNDRFSITDEAGEARYFAEGELFSWGKRLHVRDTAGREVAFVEQRLFTLRPRYRVFAGEAFLGEVVQEFAFFRPCFSVEGAEWDVEGDFWAHDYSVTRRGVPVGHISKEWFTWGDRYALEVADPANAVCALALVLAIDCIMEQNRD